MSQEITITETVPTFPNGFQNYIETFFHLSGMIQDNYEKNWNNDNLMNPVKEAQGFGGHMALCELAKEWTAEFEKKYEDEEWIELDWYGSLEAFFDEKNKAR